MSSLTFFTREDIKMISKYTYVQQTTDTVTITRERRSREEPEE
jgi:hypothetical protein